MTMECRIALSDLLSLGGTPLRRIVPIKAAALFADVLFDLSSCERREPRR